MTKQTDAVNELRRMTVPELDDYLSKPYQEAQLLDAIAPLVERHREQQSSRKLAAPTAARVN